MNKQNIKILPGTVLIFCAMQFSACQRDTPAPVPMITNLNGKWSGVFQGPRIKGSKFILELHQSSTTVKGRFYTGENPIGGEIQGTFQDKRLILTLKQLTPPDCIGSFAAGGRLENNKINLFVSGTNCYATLADEQVVLTNQ